MKVFIETDRFLLRELELSDVDGMFALDSDPEVHQFLGNKPIKSKEEALETIQFIRQQYIDLGIGRWAIIDKKNNDFVGWAGLKLITEPINNHQNFYDIGYRLRKEFWGKGVATECAQAIVQYAFNELNLKEIFAMADTDNEGSNKILKKIGMQFMAPFEAFDIQQNWYQLTKEDFKNSKQE